MSSEEKKYGLLGTSFAASELRRAGLGLALALSVLSLVSFYLGRMERYETLSVASALVLCISVFAPGILLPVHFAVVQVFRLISFLSNLLLLGLVFYLVFAPVGIFLRLFRIDWLDQRLEPDRESYWQKREAKTFDRERVKKQY